MKTIRKKAIIKCGDSHIIIAFLGYLKKLLSFTLSHLTTGFHLVHGSCDGE